jgi:hypothetical protein
MFSNCPESLPSFKTIWKQSKARSSSPAISKSSATCSSRRWASIKALRASAAPGSSLPIAVPMLNCTRACSYGRSRRPGWLATASHAARALS